MANQNGLLPLNFAPIPTAAQPSPTNEITGLISALAGLGLNVGSIFTPGAGAAGNASLSLAQQLNDEAEKRNKANADYQGQQKIGIDLAQVINRDVRDPLQRKGMITRIENYEAQGANSDYKSYMNEQQQKANQQKYELKDSYGQAGLIAADAQKKVAELSAALPPSVMQNVREKAIFEGQKAPFTDHKQLMQAYNAKTAKGEKKLSVQDAKQLFNKQAAFLTSKKEGALNTPLGQFFGSLPNDKTTSDLFSDYDAAHSDPSEYQQYQSVQQQIEGEKARAEAARQIAIRLKNPKTAPQAQKDLDLLLGGSTPGQQQGPKPGDVVDGYKFKGGDASKQSSWEKVK